uniref:Uncharacterized protein n=1 Tax=Arundo donax TaxID=35708 RepID=A0A0A8YW33_ARUDO
MNNGAGGVGSGSGCSGSSSRRRGSATATAKGKHVQRRGRCSSVATTSCCLVLIVLQLRRHGDVISDPLFAT